MNHWPSDRIGREIMKKRKDEMCVWGRVESGLYPGSYAPGCNHQMRIYVLHELCHCGKKVEVEK